MHVIARKTLVEFYNRPDCRDAKGALESCFYEAKNAQWQTPSDIKAHHGSASILKYNRVVFNLGGNKYRLVVRINYNSRTVFIRFIGKHKEYDLIDPEEI